MNTLLLKITVGATLLGLLAACTPPMPPGAPSTMDQSPQPTVSPIDTNRIVVDAVVVPERFVDVTFDQSGTVVGVFVDSGDTVETDDPLARLDTRDLELQVAQNRANLAQAQARYDRIAAGATEAEIAAQQGLVRNAEANLSRTQQGNYTAADIANAQAQVRQAEATLAAVLNPAAGDLRAAEERVRQAEVALQSTRDSTSQIKTSSELALQQSADSLTQAQASYAQAKSDWDYVQDTGANPAQPRTPTGQTNRVNNSQREQYYAAFVQAEAGLRIAEKSVTDAQVVLDQARNNEVSAIQTAESQLADAQAQLAALQNPDPNRVAQQQAAVEQARANLQRVQQGGTQAEVAAAEASVAQQQANLERLTVPPRVVDLAEAQAQIEAAQVALQQAERSLEQATLRAPFAGTIAERQLEVGQRVSGGMSGGGAPAPFVLADYGNWRIETDNLSERDVVRIQVGDPAEITFDALPDLTLTGMITAIQNRGTDRFGDIIYSVTITPDTWDERLRWNMSASVIIDTAQ